MHLFAFIVGIISKDFLCPLFFLIFFLIDSWKRVLQLLLCCGVGLGWSLTHEHLSKPVGIENINSKIHHFDGKVRSFLAGSNNHYHCLVDVLEIDSQKVKAHIQLHIQEVQPKIYPGEHWQWSGRIWQPLTTVNAGPVGQWYQDRYRHIDAHSASVLHSLKKISEISRFDVFNRIRANLYQKAYHTFQNEFSRSVFLTLVLGVGSELSAQDWSLFKSTGTAHLMVVSGAHLGLLMGIVAWLSQKIWKMWPNACLLWPAKRVATILALVIGLFYAILSGFGIPIQRAWLMLFMTWYRYLGPVRVHIWQAFRWSLFIIIAIEPHAIWYPGAHLSFFAVAILIYITRIPLKTWQKSFFAQLMCTLGMSPLTILWFENLPIFSVIANMIAIPWVSWVILPIALIVAITNIQIFNSIFVNATHLLQWFLDHLQQWDTLQLKPQWPNSATVWLLLGSLILCVWLPKRSILIWASIFMFMLIYPHFNSINQGGFNADVLDVGQGLAVMIRTKEHSLLFDTGGLGIAERVILPYLKQQKITQLDKMVISHPDMDHRGGLVPLMAQFPHALLVVDDTKVYHAGTSCHGYSDWCWDGVCFHFMQYHVQSHSKNNHSCVLQVTNKHYQLLLTGDIERAAEYQILHSERAQMPSTVLLMPHHGSNTSSSYWFLDSVKPKLAVVSVALRNAYHLPNPQAILRYKNMGIPWVSTAEHGMVRLIFNINSWHHVLWKNRDWIDQLL